MEDRAKSIRLLVRTPDLLEKVWPDQLGREVGAAVRAIGNELAEIEARQEERLEKVKTIRLFCESVIDGDESDWQKRR